MIFINKLNYNNIISFGYDGMFYFSFIVFGNQHLFGRIVAFHGLGWFRLHNFTCILVYLNELNGCEKL